MTSAVTKGLPSRSPPIQLPILQERGQLAGLIRRAVVQTVLQRAMQPRHLVQESVIVERKAVGDLVEHGELGTAQQIGLPQRQHRAAQLLVARLDFFRRELDAFAPIEQRRDFHFAIDGALAANFGRMRGQHRTDQRFGEKPAQVGGADSRPHAHATASAPACPVAAIRRRCCGRASAGCCSGPRRYWRGARNS